MNDQITFNNIRIKPEMFLLLKKDGVFDKNMIFFYWQAISYVC